jgi:hypothetical protein
LKEKYVFDENVRGKLTYRKTVTEVGGSSCDDYEDDVSSEI